MADDYPVYTIPPVIVTANVDYIYVILFGIILLTLLYFLSK